MFPENVQEALNKQINLELRAYYAYLAMGAYFEELNLKGFARWVLDHAEEEMAHAMKIYHFILDRRSNVKLLSLPEPAQHWDSPLAALEAALQHEQKVTASINNLVQLARQEGDYATDNFLQWFVAEQVEEEEVVDDLMQKVRMVSNDNTGLLILDQSLGGSE